MPSIPASRFGRLHLAFTFALVASIAGGARDARAENPLNSSEKVDTEAGPPSKPPPPNGKTDFTIVPVAGGSSDVGVGGGFFAGLTGNKKGYDPFFWHLEAAGFITFDEMNRRVDVPFLDIYSKLTVVKFLGAPLQLEMRPSFTQERALYYYGIGNASSATPPAGKSSQYFEYGRGHPEFLADLHFKIVDHVSGKVGLRYIETWYEIPTDSKLADDARSGPAEVRGLIGPTGTQGAGQFRYGLQLDTRDNETSAHTGTWDEVNVSLSPGGTSDLPFRYGEVNAIVRGYVPVVPGRVTLAARVVGDVMFGNVPLFELSHAADNYALGGSNGVRGVPAQRYYGKVKVFGNVEVRAKLFDFKAFGKDLRLGVAAFFDGGRLWADTSPHPELDGRGIGLKYGTGGGLRLMSGTAFVLRGDVAWSPDATPIGGYVIAGEIF